MHLRIKDTSIFDYMILTSVVLTCVLIAIRGSGRIRYNDAIDDKEKRKAVKDHKAKKPKDILSMRFGEGNTSDEDDDSSDMNWGKPC